MTGPEVEPLARVKALVAEMLKFPGAPEKMKAELLSEMENGGYEKLLHMLMNRKIPDDFDPSDRPWNRH